MFTEMNYDNLTIEELTTILNDAKKESEFLKLRKKDVALYYAAYKKYLSDEHVEDIYEAKLKEYADTADMQDIYYHRAPFLYSLPYGRLCDHPEYYTKWRCSFFDTNINLITTGIYQRHPNSSPNETILDRKAELRSKYPEGARKSNLATCDSYDSLLSGITSFSALIRECESNRRDKAITSYDTYASIIGYCDAIREEDNKYQLHLVDPTGDCLFPPFDITEEEARLALGKICVVNCIYNATRLPRLLELQILPYNLYQKLGDYETDTIIIVREPEYNAMPLFDVLS